MDVLVGDTVLSRRVVNLHRAWCITKDVGYRARPRVSAPLAKREPPARSPRRSFGVHSERGLGSLGDTPVRRQAGVFTAERPRSGGAAWESDLAGWRSSSAVVALTLSEGAIGMVESHDSHDESSAESPVRAPDEEPTEAHGSDESEESGGPGAGPEGADRKDTHKEPEAQDDE